jgi:hypothetical protein
VNDGAVRGFVLIAVAVLIGAILLGKGLDDTVSTASSDGGSSSDESADTGGTGGTDDEGTGDDSVGSPLAPSEINVIVANGSGVADAAAAVSTVLTGLGYTPLPPTNTVVDTTETPLDTVYFATNPNTQPQAEQVASDLGLPASSVLAIPAADAAPAPMGLAQVLVVLGSAEGGLAFATSGTGTTPTTVG